MWLPGHLAFSLLLCLPFIVYLKRERALAVVTVAAFALLPDLLHLGMLRAFSHSLVGLIFMLALTLVPMVLLFRPRFALVAIAMVAAAGHLLADLYVGSVWPFYPWNVEWVQVHQFNTPFDIRLEVALSIIALVFLLVLGPLRALRDMGSYTAKERTLTAVLAVAAAVLAFLQGGYFIIVSEGPGLDLYRSALLAFMGLSFLAALAVLARSLTLRGRPATGALSDWDREHWSGKPLSKRGSK